MKLPETITIDGPAASGKTTLAKKLAEAIGYLYFDTGIMYRAVTLAVLEKNIPVDAEAQISTLAEEVQIDVRPPSVQDGRNYDVWINGQDITWKIRQPEVEANVSIVSAYPRVRQALTAHQRRIARAGKVVMAGRDIGTVVLPDADLKIYLDASVEERARRRWQELRERGQPADYEEILAAMQARDEYDSNRDLSPLRPADDAVILSSDGLDEDQVLERVIHLLKGT